MLEFDDRRPVGKTRKDHVCDGCRTTIPASSAAIYVVIKWDGAFNSYHMHPDCEAASNHWFVEAGIDPLEGWQGMQEETAANSLSRAEVEDIIGDWPTVVDRLFPEAS